MKKNRLKASSLKKAMTTMIILIITLTGVGVYFAFDKINTLAVEIKNEITKTPILGIKTDNTQALTRLQSDITKYQPIADQLINLTTSSENTKNQTMQDINTYASANNIKVSDFNFPEKNTSNASPTTALNSANTNTSSVVITITNNISYVSLLKFIKSIETNIPKMQIKNLSISSVQNSTNNVKVEPMTIEVYTR